MAVAAPWTRWRGRRGGSRSWSRRACARLAGRRGDAAEAARLLKDNEGIGPAEAEAASGVLAGMREALRLKEEVYVMCMQPVSNVHATSK